MIDRESDSSSDSDSDAEESAVRDQDDANIEDSVLTLTDDNQTSSLVIPDFEGHLIYYMPKYFRFMSGFMIV